MELHVTDKNRKAFSDNRTRKTGLYENTIIGNAGVEITESQHTQQVEHEEGLYEKLRFERKFDEKETKQAEDEANRLKCVIYVIASMLIVLYIGVIIAIIIISRQTQQVDGIWAPWSNWTSCDVSCGNGTQERTRKCSNPAPSNGGADCIGHNAENVQCIRDLCADHGEWSTWSAWGLCSATCDFGIQKRDRFCSDSYHSNFSENCYGQSHDERICLQKACRDGRWSNWERWSTCSLTCGGGIQTRSRSCTNPNPSVGGQYCTGDPLHVQSCNISRCPIDGNWAHWSTWSSCDVSCDNGTQIRTRTCTHPPSANGGADCIGQSTEHMPCTKGLCPVHGGWTTWSGWGSCSSTCDFGIQRRYRSCSNPYPSSFGEHCFGESRDDRICLQSACSNGGWTNWHSWSACSMTCGGGMQSRSRTCTKPRPSVLGQNCIGNPRETKTCNSERCPPVVSAFSVDKPLSYSSFNGTSKLTFSHVIYQHGGDFSLATGTFKCSKPGVFHFIVTLVKKRSSARVDQVYCDLENDRSQIIHIQVDPTDDDSDKGSAAITESAIIHLNRGDTVYLSGCTNPPSAYMEYWTSFTGFLLYPDS